jgi:hypothetical protein
MSGVKIIIVLKSIYRFLRRMTSIVLVAFMLGMSNVILEEDRMVNDSRAKIEVQEVQPEDD